MSARFLVHQSKEGKMFQLTKEKLGTECDSPMTAAFSNRSNFLCHQNKKAKYETDAQNQVEHCNESVFHINSLPEEILIKIFGYLSHNEFHLIARVCKKWKTLSKTPVLWKIVDVDFPWKSFHITQTDVVLKFIRNLPSCTSHIRLCFNRWPPNSFLHLDFEDFSFNLQRVCPNLVALVLDKASLSCSLSSVINLCVKFLPNIKILHFGQCAFTVYSVKANCDSVSKVEVLNIPYCESVNKPSFFNMPCLKELNISFSDAYYWFRGDTTFLNNLEVLNVSHFDIRSIAFPIIKNVALNLTELYICHTDVIDKDLKFNSSTKVFTHLKIICIYGCNCVTMSGVLSVIRSCRSLQKIYVCDDIWKDETYAAQHSIHNDFLKVIKIKGYYSDGCHKKRDYLYD